MELQNKINFEKVQVLSLLYFCCISKRREQFKEFQAFTNVEYLEILIHCQTRWLSLEKVVKRVLNQYPALISYFNSHPDNKKPGRVKRCTDMLNNPLTKLTLHFLEYILPVINDFNKLFQVGA